MRIAIVLMALAALAGCQDPPREDRARESAAPAEVTPAALAYEGSSATDPAARLAHGERMGTMFGCTGCHGDRLEGSNVTKSDPAMGDMWAPNLSLLLKDYSDSDLERVIRKGIPRDGRTFWFMPSESFQYMSDADLAALTAWLRTVKPTGKPTPPIRKGPLFEKLVAANALAPAPEMVKRFQASQPVDLGPGHALGRHIAMTVCTECHNSALQGYPDFSPNLDLAGAYDPPELVRLLTTGEGKSRKDLGLMSITARHRFARFTPAERDAIIAYVKARADRPQ